MAHVPVLAAETADLLDLRPGDAVVDCTFGAGGHAALLEPALRGNGVYVAVDRDPLARGFFERFSAQATAETRFLRGDFALVLRNLVATGMRAQAVLMDLGVSSMQIDEPERGFSFMRDGPLDMRMGPDGPSAADLVNTLEPAELARIFFVYGEERQSRRIAAALARRRALEPFARTLDLAESVEKAVGGRRGAPIHPATRVFQALRIAVNQELSELEAGLDAAERVLRSGGKLAVVTFHSLEDRIVKAFFTERAGRLPAGSRHLPPSAAGPEPTFELLFKGARAPGPAEMAANPRARSAKLRAGVRTAAPAFRRAA
jgi:16S rRNA (cytosine1402-N4)-methyltransferase